MLLTQAFLADIVENPGDDAPRLICADWLDEQDDQERAEFIRLQCRLLRLSPDDPEQRILAGRETDLLHRNAASWRAGLPKLEGITWGDFNRGFVEAVFAQSVDAFLQQAPALFTAAPVRRLQLGWLDAEGARRLALSPYLGQLTELNLGNNSGLCRRGVQILAGSPHLARLTALLLHYNPLGDETVSDVAGSKNLRELRELYLSGTEIGNAGASALAGSGHLPQLNELDLRDNRIGDAGTRGVAFNVGLGQLTTLWLVNNQIGEAGAEALAWTEHLPRLQHLYLNYNSIGDAGAQAFAASPHRSNLRELDLGHCDIGDAGARALAGSVHLEGLRKLWLSGNRLRTEVLVLLRQRFGERLRI